MTEQLAIPARVDELVRHWLGRKSAGTVAAYKSDLADFARFTGEPRAEAAVRRLLLAGEHQARMLVLAYQADLLQRPTRTSSRLAASTVNRRLSALRSVVALAKLVGLCSFELEIPCLPTSRRGELGRLDHEGAAMIIAHLAAAAHHGSDEARERARRDLALTRLLWDAMLRRDEVFSLDYPAHVELGRRVLVLVDAKTSQGQRLEVPIGDETHAALELWLSSRGHHPGPLLHALDRRSLAHRGQCEAPRRLSLRGVNKIVRRVARAAGVGEIRPHDFRRGSATRLLDLTSGNVRDLQQHGRWSDPATAMRYDQRRREAGPRLPNLLGSDLPTPTGQRPLPTADEDDDDDD